MPKNVQSTILFLKALHILAYTYSSKGHVLGQSVMVARVPKHYITLPWYLHCMDIRISVTVISGHLHCTTACAFTQRHQVSRITSFGQHMPHICLVHYMLSVYNLHTVHCNCHISISTTLTLMSFLPHGPSRPTPLPSWESAYIYIIIMY